VAIFRFRFFSLPSSAVLINPAACCAFLIVETRELQTMESGFQSGSQSSCSILLETACHHQGSLHSDRFLVPRFLRKRESRVSSTASIGIMSIVG